MKKSGLAAAREVIMQRVSGWICLLALTFACAPASPPVMAPSSQSAMRVMSDEEATRLAEANKKRMLDAPGSPSFKFFNGRTVMLTEDMHYRIMNSGITITVPKGFVTDFASIPRVFWIFLPPTGRYSRAAIIHDWLYWIQVCTRAQSDSLLFTAMIESQVSEGVQWIVYDAVAAFGGFAWRGNAEARRQGYVRFVTPPFDIFPPNTEWESYGEMLRTRRAPDVPRPDDLRFCRLGEQRSSI